MHFAASPRREAVTLAGVLAFAMLLSGQLSAYPLPERGVAPDARRDTTDTLAFERNEGQFDERARFAVRLGSTTAFVTDDAIVFPTENGASIQLTVEGASPLARATGERPLAATNNYLFGDDPSDWHTDVTSFAQVRCSGVLPGVDLVVYGRDGQLEFDFVVAPGASADAIRFRFEGAERVELARDGSLRVSAGRDVLTQRAPRLYQGSGSRRTAVGGRYCLVGATTVGFVVGAYDRSLPLVVDPVLTYASYLGGKNANDEATAIAVDAQGNAYVTGHTPSKRFPTTAGAFQTNRPGLDVFISKINPTGTALEYSTYLGGSGEEFCSSIAVDAFGEATVTGYTTSRNFPLANGLPAPGDGVSAYVTRLNATGTGLVYSTYLGGTAGESGLAVAVDGDRNVYVVGYCLSMDFPTTPGAFQTVRGSADKPDAFVVKIDTTASGASSLVYSTYLGGSADDRAFGVAVSASGEAYVSGAGGIGFPTTPTAYQPLKPGFFGNPTAILTRLNAEGSDLVYSTFLGASQAEYANGIAIDGTGIAYVAGQTSSMDFPTTAGAFQASDPGVNSNEEGFVAKLDTNATGAESLVYSTYLGGNSVDGPVGLALLSTGAVAVGFHTQSADFPLRNSLFGFGGIGVKGIVTVVNPSGSGLIYSTPTGGSNGSIVYAVAVGPDDAVFYAGSTTSADFPVTPGAFQRKRRGIADAIVGKLSMP